MKKSKLSKKTKQYRLFYKSKSIFREWLQENISRFPYKPITNGKGGFYFEGISKAISLYIDFSQPEAELHFNHPLTNENYDLYTIQYIGQLKHHLQYGFYDADRVDKIFTYYDSYAELIITEVFEPIIEYMHEYFKKESYLYLIETSSYTEGFISPSKSNIYEKKLLKLRQKNDVKLFQHPVVLIKTPFKKGLKGKKLLISNL